MKREGLPIHRSSLCSLFSGAAQQLEVLWKELRKEHFHNRVFKSMDAVDDQLEIALR
jgi:hypothetical protein